MELFQDMSIRLTFIANPNPVPNPNPKPDPHPNPNPHPSLCVLRVRFSEKPRCEGVKGMRMLVLG